MLDVQIARKPVNGGSGELVVVFENTEANRLDDVKVTCRFEGGPELMSVIPPPHIGYCLGSLDPPKTISPLGGPNIGAGAPPNNTVPFSITPRKAEVGKHYIAIVEVSCELLIKKQSTRRIVDTEKVSVFLEPRPEVYFALGVADTVRRLGLGFYMQMIRAGKDAHAKTETALPEFLRGGDPTQGLMGDESFRWAMSMVELGARIYNSQTKK